VPRFIFMMITYRGSLTGVANGAVKLCTPSSGDDNGTPIVRFT